MIMMPLTYTISEGIVFGVLSYIVLKVATGAGRSVPLLTYIVGAFFLVSFFV